MWYYVLAECVIAVGECGKCVFVVLKCGFVVTIL